MFKLYKKADILEKISDKVKTVDDLYHLPAHYVLYVNAQTRRIKNEC